MSTPNESSTNDQATTFPYFNLRFSIEHVFFFHTYSHHFLTYTVIKNVIPLDLSKIK